MRFRKTGFVLALLFLCLFLGMESQNVWAESVCHTHTGDAVHGGGCYTKDVLCGGSPEAYKVPHDCGTRALATYAYDENTYEGNAPGTAPVGVCPSCGSHYYRRWYYGYSHVCDAQRGQVSVGAYYACKDCGYSTLSGGTYAGGTINPLYYTCSNRYYTEAYRCSKCHKECTQADYKAGRKCREHVEYAVDCGYSDGELLVDITMNEVPTEPVNHDVELKVFIKGKPEVMNTAAIKWQDGSTAATFNAPENGTYSCSVTVSDCGQLKTVSLSTTVGCIDKEPPVVTLLTDADLSTWYEGSICLYGEAHDTGLGLPEEPYSFDGGVTFVSEGKLLVDKNGTYEVLVKDRAGNTTAASLTVTMAVKPAPKTPEPLPSEIPTVAPAPSTAPAPSVQATPTLSGGTTPPSSGTPGSVGNAGGSSVSSGMAGSPGTAGSSGAGTTTQTVPASAAPKSEGTPAPTVPSPKAEPTPKADTSIKKVTKLTTTSELLSEALDDGYRIPYYLSEENTDALFQTVLTQNAYPPLSPSVSPSASASVLYEGVLDAQVVEVQDETILGLGYKQRMILFGTLVLVILGGTIYGKQYVERLLGVRMKGNDGEYHYIAHIPVMKHRGRLQVYLRPALIEKIDRAQVRLHFSERFMKKNQGHKLLVLWQEGQLSMQVEQDVILHLT